MLMHVRNIIFFQLVPIFRVLSYVSSVKQQLQLLQSHQDLHQPVCGSHIPVQSTAKARRRFQNPGRGTATYGKKEKVVEKRSQMVIDDENDEDLTWHSLLTGTQSQIKTKKPHKLSDSIKNNVSAARKHEKTMF